MRTRTLPADVYDALELSAYAHRGIGEGIRWNRDGETPCCIAGHAEFVSGYVTVTESAVALALAEAGLTISDNDGALADVGKDRVSWDEYCRLLNIVRGDV